MHALEAGAGKKTRMYFFVISILLLYAGDIVPVLLGRYRDWFTRLIAIYIHSTGEKRILLWSISIEDDKDVS